jgi:predicted acetyltransferase
MQAAALPVAAALGLEWVLLTCDVDNLASHKVIQTSGGLLPNEIDGKLRYWLPRG